MRKMMARIGSLALVMAVALAIGSCEKKQEPKEEPAAKPAGSMTKDVQPAAKEPAKPAQKTAQPTRAQDTGAAVSAEDYWNIQLERLEATKQHYQDILAVYEKHEDDSAEAKQEVRELRQKNQEKMQEIFKSHGFSSGRDFFPRGAGRRQVLKERQEYLKNDTELWEKYQALNKEIRDLRTKVREYRRDEEGPGVRGRRGRRGPGGGPPEEGGAEAPADEPR